MLWAVNEKGFFPACNPLTTIPVHDYNNTQLVYSLENLAYNMPSFLADRRWREELVYELRALSPTYGHGVIDRLGTESEIERAFLLLSLFACAYTFAHEEKPIYRVPKEVSIPLARAAHLVSRHPVLTYTSYVLYNWQLDRNGDRVPIHTFTESELEKELLKTFLQMEQRFADATKHKADSPLAFMKSLLGFLEETIKDLRYARAVADVDELKKLSSYYRQFDEVAYEGWQPQPKTYSAEVFTQAPLFSYLYKLFGIVFKDALLQRQESDISNYQPVAHRAFVAGVGSLRNVVNNKEIEEVYNECLKSLASLHNEMFMLHDYARWSLPRIRVIENHYIR